MVHNRPARPRGITMAVPTMTREGEPYGCRVCGREHTIKADRSDKSVIFGHIEYLVECPEYGEIV